MREETVTPIGLPSDITAITTGAHHSCALSSSGAVKCWGDNLAGQLRNGTKGEPASVPVAVMSLGSILSIGIVCVLAAACGDYADSFGPALPHQTKRGLERPGLFAATCGRLLAMGAWRISLDTEDASE